MQCPQRICRLSVLTLALVPIVAGGFNALAAEKSAIVLHARSRAETESGSGDFRQVEKELKWDPQKTAIVICDMWDAHWCRGATTRVAEMAPRMNEVVAAARQRGVLVIHCPSGCLEAYRGTPMRKRVRKRPP